MVEKEDTLMSHKQGHEGGHGKGGKHEGGHGKGEGKGGGSTPPFGFPTGGERDPVMKAVADVLRASGKAEEFKGLAAGSSFSLSASGRLFGHDGSSVSISITKGTHAQPTPPPNPPAPETPTGGTG